MAVNSNNRKHVLFVQGSSGFGGSKHSLMKLIDVLGGTRYQPVVACPERGWLTEQLERSGTPYVLVPFFAWRKWLERPRVRLSIRKRWLPALDPWDLGIIHCNEFWWAPHAIILAEYLGIPVAVHLRDGHHTLKKALQYHLDRADMAFAVSTDVRAHFSSHPQLFEKTHLLFDGHDENGTPRDLQKIRERFNIRPGEFVLGNIGRICERKNQRMLLRVMAQLKEQGRLTRFKILFAGGTDSDYAKRMAQDIERLGLQGQVDFLGIVDDMGAFFSATDLIVHCARREGLSRVIPEAMLSRRVVVTLASEGMRDAIPDERFGLVVPMDDMGSFQWQIEDLLKNPARRECIANQAYERARSLFTMEAHHDNVVRFYDALMDRKTITSQ